jgi:hypothetical protein
MAARAQELRRNMIRVTMTRAQGEAVVIALDAFAESVMGDPSLEADPNGRALMDDLDAALALITQALEVQA